MKMSTRDGRSKTKLYRVWKSMKARCLYPTNVRFQNYGGRGIYVVSVWLIFENFRDWALLNGYKEGLSIDRINNDGPYSPDNCRWVTTKENNRKRTTSHMITYNGETRCLSEWAEIINVKPRTLHARISDYRWTPEEAIEGKRL